MDSFSVFRSIACAMAMCALVILSGCDSGYESTDEFLERLPTEGTPREELVGSLPPVDDTLENAAKIRIETDEFDMGEIAHDDLAHAKLKVYNDGGMPLTITRIDTTCACTQGVIAPDNSTIPPGGETWIDVVVNPYRIPGFESRKVLTITSTDAITPSVSVGVSARVKPEFEIGPTEIELGDIAKGESLEKRIRFRQLIDKEVTIKELVPFSGASLPSAILGLETEVVPLPEEDWQTAGRPEYDLVFRFAPDLPVGPFKRTARLVTDIRSGDHGMLLNFEGVVIAPYSLDPPSPVPLIVDPEIGGFRASVRVSAATPLEILEVTSPDAATSTTLSPGDSPNEAQIDVVYKGKIAAGEFSGTVLNVPINVAGKSYTEKVALTVTPPLR